MGGTICRVSRQQDQVSKALLWLPWFFVNRFLESTRIAEERLGAPPTIFEIQFVMKELYDSTLNNYTIAAVFFSIFREDMIRMNSTSSRFTIHRQEGFYTYSDFFRLRYPVGYGCDSSGRIVATTARTLNLYELHSILTSKDETLLTENNWMWDGQFRFLDM